MTLTVPERWRMNSREEDYLAALPEVVDLYRAYSEAGETFYLTSLSGYHGMRAYAYSGVGRLEHVAVAKEMVLAVDLGRDVVQLRAKGG